MHSGDLHYGLSPLKISLEFPSKVKHKVSGVKMQAVLDWKLRCWKIHLTSLTSTMATSSPTSFCYGIHLFSVRNGDGDQKNGSCGHRLSLGCFRLSIYFRTFTSHLNLLLELEPDCGLLCQAHLTGNPRAGASSPFLASFCLRFLQQNGL